MSWQQKLNLLQDLTPGVYLEECIEDVKTFRNSYPKALPSSLSTETCARYVDINVLIDIRICTHANELVCPALCITLLS